MKTLCIKHKLMMAFSSLLLILLIVSIVSWQASVKIQSKADALVDEIQPSMIAALSFEVQLERTAKQLGYFLKSGESGHKKSYVTHIELLKEKMLNLKNQSVILVRPELVTLVEEIEGKVERFTQYRSQLEVLGSSMSENMSALKYMNNVANPLVGDITQALNNMITAEEDEDVSEERREIFTMIQELRYSVTRAVSALRGYIGIRADGLKGNTETYIEKYEIVMKKLEARSDELGFEQAEAFEKLKVIIPKYTVAVKEIIRVQGSDKAFMDVYLLANEISPLTDDIESLVTSLVSKLKDMTKDESNAMVDAIQSTVVLVLGLLVIGLVVGGLVAWLMSQNISQRLLDAVYAMEDIASGEANLSNELIVAGQDELGQLSTAFNKFLAKIRGTIIEVGEVVLLLGDASKSMSQVTAQTSAGAHRQAEETSQVATTMTEMLATSEEMAQMANNASQEAETVNVTAREGQSIADDSVISIQELVTQVESASDVMMTLENDSQEIGGVLSVIRGIADQTNLLALNAAIEAARAGEQGRGFAVVADEVRTLASRTQESTAEIQAVIERLQLSTKKAASVMELGREQAQSTADQIGNTRDSLSAIGTAVEGITQTNIGISQGANEQVNVVGEVNYNIVSINDITEETSQGVQKLDQVVNELSDLSSRLQSLVGGFKTHK